MTGILATRLSSIMCEISDMDNSASAPGRYISDNAMLLQLLQNFLDHEELEGFVVFYDWTKCFDLIAWKYIHAAMEALGFGPDMMGWVHTLYNLDHPAKRAVAVNGLTSLPFFIRRSIAQGDSISSILQVIVFEALSRALDKAPYEGIDIPTVGNQAMRADGGEATVDETATSYTVKKQQFADDTAALMKDISQFPIATAAMDRFALASTSRRNESKQEALAFGTSSPEDASEFTFTLRWARDHCPNSPDFLTPLGSPLAAGEDIEKYWERMYLDFKSRLVTWTKSKYTSIAGKILLSKAMLVSVATYNFSTHLPPEWLLHAMKTDLTNFIWDSEPEAHIDQVGSSATRKQWLPESWASLPVQAGGLATLDLRCFSDALLLSWIPRYLDPRMPTWKLLPDLWLSQATGPFRIGPKAVLFSSPTAGKVAIATPSLMWTRVVEKWMLIREKHELTRAYKLSTWEQVMAEPLWFNPEIKLQGLKITQAILDGTTINRWELIARLGIHTLRDLWDSTDRAWMSERMLLHYATYHGVL